MSATAWAWLVLLFPLVGSIAIALGFRALSARGAGAIGTAAIFLSFACGVQTLLLRRRLAGLASHGSNCAYTNRCASAEATTDKAIRPTMAPTPEAAAP